MRNGPKESGLRVVSVERVLLVAILGMQLVIAWGLYQRAPQEVDAETERPVVADVARTREPEVNMYPILPSRPVSFPRRDLFDDMDAFVSDAFQNMARLRSAMHIDEGWDVLSASPTMDMRDGDSDYRVSFSIPGARPSARIPAVAVTALPGSSKGNCLRSRSRTFQYPMNHTPREWTSCRRSCCG